MISDREIPELGGLGGCFDPFLKNGFFHFSFHFTL